MMGKERPSYKQRHKRKSRIVRTLSSISEKSNEFAAADAALQVRVSKTKSFVAFCIFHHLIIITNCIFHQILD